MASTKKPRLWSSKKDRVRHVFTGAPGHGDAVRKMEEDVGFDSGAQFADAELPMDSPERMEAIEAQKRHRADDE